MHTHVHVAVHACTIHVYLFAGRGGERESGKFHRYVSFRLSTIIQDSEQGVKPRVRHHWHEPWAIRHQCTR